MSAPSAAGPDRRILCFGDSNTYGYDPRSPLGDRYPPDVRWTALLNAQPGWTVVNCGQNGRQIPCRPPALEAAERELAAGGVPDGLVLLLGGNDLLQAPALTAEAVAGRMAVFLARVAACSAVADAGARVLLVAPPPLRLGAWVDREELVVQSQRLGRCYRAVARRQGAAFADAGGWNVELAFDGVHFSPAGHRAFARGLISALKTLFQESR